ncbi:MAG: hypothetical protein WC794_03325 [Candidatus Doudnabacteria bacterium]|jgi:hypothetical protein
MSDGHGGGHEIKSRSADGGGFNMLKPLGVKELTTGLHSQIVGPATELPGKVAGTLEGFMPGLGGGSTHEHKSH